MRFNFSVFNHSEIGRASLQDPIQIIANQLTALGHKAEHSDEIILRGKEGINILIEGFTPYSINFIKEGKTQHDARFIFIATEEPTPKGFNYGADKYMIMRQAIFPEAAKYAEAILALVPNTASWYSKYAPAEQIELGYAPGLVRPQFRQPDADYGFYGSISRRRDKILKRLQRMGTVKRISLHDANASDQQSRDLAMQGAKVIVQIRILEKMGLVSSSRCATALSLGRPVIAEPHELSRPWDQIIRFSANLDDFYKEVQAYKPFWKALHMQQFERFRDIMTPAACIGNALGRLGIRHSPANSPSPYGL